MNPQYCKHLVYKTLKYNKVANDIGLSLSAFARYSMARPKGSPNKITSEVKEKLQLIIDDLIASLNVNE